MDMMREQDAQRKRGKREPSFQWNRCHTSRHHGLAIFCWLDQTAASTRPVFLNVPSSLKHGFSHAYWWRHIRKHQRTIVCHEGAPKTKLRTLDWCFQMCRHRWNMAYAPRTDDKTLENTGELLFIRRGNPPPLKLPSPKRKLRTAIIKEKEKENKTYV